MKKRRKELQNPMEIQRLNPGPIDGSVLTLQHQHRSSAIWNKNDPGSLSCRRRDSVLRKSMRILDNRMIQYLISSGFYGVHCLQFIRLDRALITALAERWRQETHTFHLAVGEATVTLQDVSILLGLPIDGLPITRPSESLSAAALCERYLGVTPPPNMLKNCTVKLSWLSQTFARLPEDADDTVVQHYTRAYILQLLIGVLYVSRSQTWVKLGYLTFLADLKKAGEYSWGSAALAWLYREMCRSTSSETTDLGGPLILLQLWAWERFPHIRPTRKSSPKAVPPGLPAGPLGSKWCVELSLKDTPKSVLWVYRDQLDQQKENQMIWEPYSAQVMRELPDYCLSGSRLWRSKCPLIYYDIVELHLPDRVLRQFGLHQEIPSPCDTLLSLHKMSRVGVGHTNWVKHHSQWISEWEKRHELIVEGSPSKGPMKKDDPYMIWYNRITRRFISPLDDGASNSYRGCSARYASMGQVLQSIIDQAKRASSAKNVATYEQLCRYIINAGELEMNRFHGILSHQDERGEASMQPTESTSGSDADYDKLGGDCSNDTNSMSGQAVPRNGGSSPVDSGEGGSAESVSS